MLQHVLELCQVTTGCWVSMLAGVDAMKDTPCPQCSPPGTAPARQAAAGLPYHMISKA